jgi:hypothetical protein
MDARMDEIAERPVRLQHRDVVQPVLQAGDLVGDRIGQRQHVAPRAAQQVRLRHARDPFETVGEPAETKLGIHFPEPVRRRLSEVPEPLRLLGRGAGRALGRRRRRAVVLAGHRGWELPCLARTHHSYSPILKPA